MHSDGHVAGTVTPYEFTIAVAENAVDNGAEFRLSREVKEISKQIKNGNNTNAKNTSKKLSTKI